MEMNEFENLPLVEFKIEDLESGLKGDLNAVSIVTSPAIELSYNLFNQTQKERSDFKVTNKDKMEITGPVMVPNKKILRFNKKEKEYFYCFFSEETVKKCAEFYLKSKNHDKSNFEHLDNFTNDVYLIETWIVEDPKVDKSKALGFEEVPKGTWFATFKVSNEELWTKLKKSDFSGFSVEGDFIYSYEQVILSKIEDVVNNETMSKEEKKKAIKNILNIN